MRDDRPVFLAIRKACLESCEHFLGARRVLVTTFCVSGYPVDASECVLTRLWLVGVNLVNDLAKNLACGQVVRGLNNQRLVSEAPPPYLALVEGCCSVSCAEGAHHRVAKRLA